MTKTQNAKLTNLDEVLERLELLREGGYTPQGNWTLGQNSQHLATMMRLEQWIGRTPIGWIAELLRLPSVFVAIGNASTRMGIRLPAMPFARPKNSEVSDDEGAARLAEAIAAQKLRKRSCSSTRFHLWHCSHHLGFLTPNHQQTPAKTRAEC